MKIIVYYDCLLSIVLLNFTMDGGTLFRVRTETRTSVLTEMLEIRLHKNEVGSYAYNDAYTLTTQIKCVIEQHLFEDSADGMKGLASVVRNTLNNYKSKLHIKKRDMLTVSRASAERASIKDSTVEPEINKNCDTQVEADLQNDFRLAAIGVKEGISEGIIKIVRRDIINPILRTTENRNFKSVDQYQIHQLFTAITEGEERPESSNIRR